MQKIQDVCTRHGLKCTSLPENMLRVEGEGFSFQVMRIETSYLLQGLVCALPDNEPQREALCTRLCALQCARLKHEIAYTVTVALSLQGSQCFLQCRIPYDGVYDDVFYNNVEDFCNLLATWKKLAQGEERSVTSVRQQAHPSLQGKGSYGSAAKFFSPDMLG